MVLMSGDEVQGDVLPETTLTTLAQEAPGVELSQPQRIPEPPSGEWQGALF